MEELDDLLTYIENELVGDNKNIKIIDEGIKKYAELWCKKNEQRIRTRSVNVIEDVVINEIGWHYDYDFLYDISCRIINKGNENISMEEVEAVLDEIGYEPYISCKVLRR